jgi:hypothetical protein
MCRRDNLLNARLRGGAGQTAFAELYRVLARGCTPAIPLRCIMSQSSPALGANDHTSSGRIVQRLIGCRNAAVSILVSLICGQIYREHPYALFSKRQRPPFTSARPASFNRVQNVSRAHTRRPHRVRQCLRISSACCFRSPSAANECHLTCRAKSFALPERWVTVHSGDMGYTRGLLRGEQKCPGRSVIRWMNG